MTESEVLTLLADNKNPRGMANWLKLDPQATGGLKSFGIGLTQLRKLAKKVGRNHELARILWRSDYYDARLISLLIEEPKKLTREQAEEQVEQLCAGLLAHVFSSCDAVLAKAPFARELALEWIERDSVRRRCGWGLIYEISKFKGKKAPEEPFFVDCIRRIESTIDEQPKSVRESMKCALMGIGKRSKELNSLAISAVQGFGPEPETDDGCEPLDVLKHLTSPYIKQKLGL